jgi:hypothetical protein
MLILVLCCVRGGTPRYSCSTKTDTVKKTAMPMHSGDICSREPDIRSCENLQHQGLYLSFKVSTH